MSGLTLKIVLYIVADILIKLWLHIDPSYVKFKFAEFYIIVFMYCCNSFWGYYSDIRAQSWLILCIQDIMPLGGEASHKKEKFYRRKKGMTPLFGEIKEERISQLLFQAMKNVKEDLKEMKGEKCRKFPRGFESEANPRYSHDGCEYSATHANPQRSLFPTFTARRMEEEDAPREETLSDYLQEYEYQSWRFKEHLDFQGF